MNTPPYIVAPCEDATMLGLQRRIDASDRHLGPGVGRLVELHGLADTVGPIGEQGGHVHLIRLEVRTKIAQAQLDFIPAIPKPRCKLEQAYRQVVLVKMTLVRNRKSRLYEKVSHINALTFLLPRARH